MTRLSQGATLLKHADTLDVERYRTYGVLSRARGILRGEGIERTWTHAGNFVKVGIGGEEEHVCCARCRCTWPGDVEDEAFERAYERAALDRRAGGM